MSSTNCNIIHFSEINSTNSYARDLLLQERPPEGTVITTDYQSTGKGQDKNSWESEAGMNILVTIILYPDFLEVGRQFSLSMSVALGIVDFLEELLPGREISIKWPNDIYVGREKIGGILINNEIMGEKFEHVIAGVGVNLNQESFSKAIINPVSIKNLTGKHYSVKEETLRLCDRLMGRYRQLRSQELEQITSDYHDLLLGMGEWREYVYKGKTITARNTGVNEYGKLLLENKDGMIECDLKELVYIF